MNRSIRHQLTWPIRRIDGAPAEITPLRIREMMNLAFTTLTKLLDNGETLCCNTMKPNKSMRPLPPHKDGIERIGISKRYSAIALIGLLKASRHGFLSPIDLCKVMDRLIAESANDDNLGNLGLVCWAASLMDEREKYADQLKLLLRSREADIDNVDTSLELQWLLTGTCKLYISCADQPWLEDMISRCYRKLSKNYRDESGLFCSEAPCQIKGKLKKNICYFSDQVYGIYSLSTYFEAFGDPIPLEWSVRNARKLCSLQGDKGQWPWLYDSRKGAVISIYPVYSVHQDAMAPMALFKLSEVSGVDFTPNLMRGLAWVFGHNELGIPMTDVHRGVIWRSIRKETKLSYTYALRIIKLIHITGLDWLRNLTNPFLSFEIDMECRPYHLGWLLYAFSGRY